MTLSNSNSKFDILDLLKHVPRPTRRVAYLILSHKVALAVLLILFPALLPTLYTSKDTFNRRIAAADTDYYVSIASDGYKAGTVRCAFYPLWPWCIRVGSELSGTNGIFSAFVMANCISWLAILLFHRLIWEKHDLPVANRATLLLMFYPGSTFFFLPYSESLFLLLTMICLLCLNHRIFWGWPPLPAFFYQ